MGKPGAWKAGCPRCPGISAIPGKRNFPKITFVMAVSVMAKAAYTPATVRCAGVLLWR